MPREQTLGRHDQYAVVAGGCDLFILIITEHSARFRNNFQSLIRFDETKRRRLDRNHIDNFDELLRPVIGDNMLGNIRAFDTVASAQKTERCLQRHGGTCGLPYWNAPALLLCSLRPKRGATGDCCAIGCAVGCAGGNFE